MKSWVVHYQNKYPGGFVSHSENSINVFCRKGKPRVALRKNGADQWVCVSKEFGCEDSHDLAPIPRNARVKKLARDGSISHDEQAVQRRPVQAALADHPAGGEGKVPSLAELEAHYREKNGDQYNPSNHFSGDSSSKHNWEWKQD